MNEKPNKTTILAKAHDDFAAWPSIDFELCKFIPTFEIMRTVLLFILVLSAIGPIRAQNADLLMTKIDSLKGVLSSARKDSARTDILYRMGANYAQFDATNAIIHYKRAIDLADSSLETGTNENLEILQSRIRSSLAVTYYLEGNFPNAIKELSKAIEIFRQYDELAPLSKCYTVMGAIYKNQKQPEEALKIHEKALEISEEVQDSFGMALALNNIAGDYDDLYQIPKSIEYYEQALAIYTAIGNQRGMGVALANLGAARMNQKKYDQALFFYRQSLKIRKKINDKMGISTTYARMGNVLIAIDSVDAAIESGLASLKLAKELNQLTLLRDAHEVLAHAYHKDKKFKEAFLHQQDYHLLEDSMRDESSIRRVADAESEFKFEKERLADSLENAATQQALKTEIALKEAEDKQQRLAQTLLIGGILVTVLLVVLSYSRYRKSQRQNQKIAEQKRQVENVLKEITKRDEEKEVLLKEIHHRVKNNLQVISSLLDLQSKKAGEGEKEALMIGQSRVRAMALIHEKLYQSKTVSEIDFKAYCTQLNQQIAQLFPNGQSVNCEINVIDVKLDIDTAVPVGLILNELITNAYKYAFPQGKGRLRISAQKGVENGYVLRVEDDGQGLPNDFDWRKSKSLGLRLVNRLAKQLYGKADYINTENSTFQVTFKDTLERKEVA